jgi:hypothetical protein
MIYSLLPGSMGESPDAKRVGTLGKLFISYDSTKKTEHEKTRKAKKIRNGWLWKDNAIPLPNRQAVKNLLK